MSTIPIEISTELLLRAIERLPADELGAFVSQIVALRARRERSHLSQEETSLMLQINQARLEPQQQARFNALVAKRQEETL